LRSKFFINPNQSIKNLSNIMESSKVLAPCQIKLENFLFDCKFHDLRELSVYATDLSNYNMFEVTNYKLKTIMCETVKAALEQKNPKNISAKITSNESLF